MGDGKSARSLHQLLDSVLALQRQDIHAFSGGHLNESNLYKPDTVKAIHTGRWKSSQPRKLPPVSHLVQAEGRHRDQLVTMTQDQMKGILKEFSVDTPLRVPQPPPVKRDAVSEAPVKVGHPQTHTEGDIGPYQWMDDGILVEEVQVSDLAVPTLTPRTRCALQQEHGERQQQFLPSYLEGITKKDQFRLMKRFEREVLGLEDTKVQNVFAGHAAVEQAETHLEAGLSSLQLNGIGPNFHKLQVYSDTFDCLIKTSPTFGYLLQTIKNKYDDFVGELLDSQSGKHQVLLDHMKQLSDGGTSNTRQLHDDISVVKRLEKEARNLLEENERLRKEVEEEIKLASKSSPELHEQQPSLQKEPAHDLSDQIEALNAAILEKYDTLQQLRLQMRTEFVPATVCTHLEQCIKETEVEIQKLNSQKDYFIRSVGEMEKKLTDTIESADTTEKDARRIWKKIERRSHWKCQMRWRMRRASGPGISHKCHIITVTSVTSSLSCLRAKIDRHKGPHGYSDLKAKRHCN